jgi:LPS-assembly lipoprotein
MTVRKIQNYFFHACAAFCMLLLCSCGFHIRGQMALPKPMQSVYIESVEPYGTLVRNLQQSLQMSNVHVVENPDEAQTRLVILRDDTSEKLLSVGGTQQTRQYKLTVTTKFEVTDSTGRILVPSQTLSESRVITVQSNQILGSSNEANLYFQQMRRTLASAIMYRLASHDITTMIDTAYAEKAKNEAQQPSKKPAT